MAALRAADVNLRRVAAGNLGMVVSKGEEDELIREADDRGTVESDPEVRWWAEFGA